MKVFSFAAAAHVLFLVAALAQNLPGSDTVALTRIAELPGYTEGAALDRDDALYVSEPLGGRISRIKDGVTTVWAKTGAPNGHRVLPDGTHLVCDGQAHAVLKLDAGGRVTGNASAESEGKPLRSPNDLALARSGFYFTDPGGSSAANPIGTVHFVDASGVTRTVARDLAFPNGIALRPDGRTLLVAESARNRILKYAVLPDGGLVGQQVFAELPRKSGEQIANEPDGLALDEGGNLFVAHYGMRRIQVIGPDGTLLRTYPAGNLTPSNLAFGGPNGDHLFITGALGEETKSKGGVFRLGLPGVRGLRLPVAFDRIGP